MPEQTHTPENAFERIPPAHPNAGHGTSTGLGGAADGNSGGGNASGTPDGETAIRQEGEPALRGEVEHDRKKLFPGA